MKKQKIVIIVGPTASGKTSLGVKLAKLFNGEIISADSMQIYKDMNIGTAKVTEEEMQGVKHHLINICLPNEEYNAWQWKKDAEDCINNLANNNKLPIIVGGTGLYVNALINGFDFGGATNGDKIVRQKYEDYFKDYGVDELYNLLKNKDEELAKSVDKNKTRAVIRYLEILDNGGIVHNGALESNYNYLLIGLNVDRAVLYKKINERVDQMINGGLEKEVAGLVKKYNLNQDMQSGNAIGYREFWQYFKNEISLEKMVELIKQHSRNYAKRQMTYMKKLNNIEWFDSKAQDAIIARVKEFYINND